MIWLIFAAALALRLFLALSYEGLWGVDGGAYFLGVAAVLGNEPTGAGFPRPPLAPGWLLFPFVHYLGIDTGYKVWSSLASILPAIPVLLFTHRVRRLRGISTTSQWVTVFAVGFLFVDWLHAEMFVTGALPMIAFALLGTAWWCMGSLCERWSRNDRHNIKLSILLAVCIGLIPFVNQTTAGLTVITLPVYAVALLWYSRGAGSPIRVLARLTPPMFVGGVFALMALPWYLEVLPGNGILKYPGPVVYFTGAYDIAWLQLILGWSMGLLMIRRGEEPWLRALGVLCCLFGTFTVFLSYDETIINVFYRSRYLLAIPFYVGITWAVFRWVPEWFLLPKARRTVAAIPIILSLMAFSFTTWGYIDHASRQADLSAMITPDTAETLQLIHRLDPDAAIINNSFTLALWISALNQVKSPHTWTAGPPARFVETDKHVRCVLGWVPNCEVERAREDLGAGFVLIEERFPFYNERAPAVWGSLNRAEPWAGLATLPWMEEIYHQGTTRV